MKIFLNLIFLSIIFYTASSCDENIYIPSEDQPGRRDYEWNIDTITSFNPLYRLWGSSPTDLWAITSGNPNENIYHFDGTQWVTGTYFILYAPYSIFGFEYNNIYIGAEQGRIYNFNGEGWIEIAALTKDGHKDIGFDNLWGTSSNNLYACGAYPDEQGYANNSVIAHFFNGNWMMLNTDGLFGIVEHLYENRPDNKIYLQVIGGRNFTDSTHIYEYSQGKYYRLYSNIWTQGLQADISLINGEVYFVLGYEITKRVNNQFQTILRVDNTNFYQRIWGRNSKDIFLMMTDGLAHYNGKDIEYLFYFNKTPRTQIFGASLFENDIFFLVYESQTGLNLIYHGKLK